MTCDKCKYLVLKHTIRGPLCFKGHDIKAVKNCKSFCEPDDKIQGLEPDVVIIDDPCIRPLEPKLKQESKLIIIGTPYGEGQ